MINTQNIALSIKNVRSKLNMNQQQLADKVGVAKTTLANWESERQIPPVDKYAYIISLLNDYNLIDDVLDVIEDKKSHLNALENTNQDEVSEEELLKLFERVHTFAKSYDQKKLLKNKIIQLEKELIENFLDLKK